MAAEVITTAVALRKGDTESNRVFVGVLGEVTADLGNETNGVLGVDGNVTLRIHNGINQGGIPLARADTRNVSTTSLAENREWFDDKNLAYADLSNIEETIDDEAIAKIVNTLSTYGMVNTEQLSTELLKYAFADMSNVVTSTLATGRGRGENGNLAYADTTNINTADLVSEIIHTGVDGNLPLAYANASNINTTNLTLDTDERPITMSGPILARSDFENITKESWQASLFNPLNELYLEQTTNKDSIIPSDIDDIQPNHYPSSLAVNNYVNSELDRRNFLKANFSNGTTYEPLYSNAEKLYRYFVPDIENLPIISNNTGFSIGTYYTGKQLSGETYLFKLVVSEYIDLTQKITAVEPYINCGLEDLNNTKITVTNSSGFLTTTITATLRSDGLYQYSCSEITGTMVGDIGDYLYPDTDIPMQSLLLVNILSVTDDQEIDTFEYIPTYANTLFVDDVYEYAIEITSDTNKTATVKLYVESCVPSQLGGAGLAKTDLSNLLGMSEKDKYLEEDAPWRIRHDENIIEISQIDINETEYFTIATKGQVHDALINAKDYIEQTSSIPNWKANTEYVITPYPSKVLYNGDIYYCITAHTSSTAFDATNWKLLSEDTFEKLANKNSNISLDTTSEIKYPTNKAVVDYVKEQIEAVHTPGHYYGQVNIFVDTENNLPGNSDPSTEYTIEPYEGLTALVQNYNNTNEPAVATYTNNAWTYKEVALQNGVYVYILDLGSSYHNGPGNATWNDENKAFDIAPDKFQVPDGITLNLNDSTGAIQIVPALQTKLSYVDVNSSIQTTIDDIYSKLNDIDANLTAMVIPSPQFFTGTGIINQQLVLTDNVAFDLYVNGVFQYPNTYAFDTETKTITLNFAVENTSENGIAVIYRGFRTLQQ